MLERALLILLIWLLLLEIIVLFNSKGFAFFYTLFLFILNILAIALLIRKIRKETRKLLKSHSISYKEGGHFLVIA